MARIRTIKPEFWTHPITGRLSDSAKWIAVALLSHADDEGYFRADPAVVRGAVAPFVDDSTSIRRALDECSRVGWIELREHPEQGWIGRIVNFAKHQRIDRPSASRIKGYWQFDESSSSIRRTFDEPSLPEGNREGNREGKGGEASPSPSEPGLETLCQQAQLQAWGPNRSAVREHINSALAAGVPVGAIAKAIQDNRGATVWQALDPLKPKPTTAAKRHVTPTTPWNARG